MLLHDVVATSGAVSETSARLGKIARLAALLKRFSPAEVPVGIAYLSGVLPQGRIGIGGSAISQARPARAASEPSLEILDVDAAFERIAGLSGAGSTNAKVASLHDLLARATRDEQDFLVRLLFGELRQGALEGVMLEAIARAAGAAPAVVRRAAMAAGDLAEVAAVALLEGEAGLARFTVQIFQPVRPMLADSAEDAGAAIARLGEAALEFKLDGARIQVHKSGDDVKAFSRHLREVTPAVPEVVDTVRSLPARELILDGEVIALRPDGRPHPFQLTMQRFGRKLDIERLQHELPLTPFLFDVLQIDGTSLIDEPQARRFEALARLAAPSLVVPHIVASNEEQADAFLAEAMRQGHEGIMAKAREAAYAAGNRGQAWLKVKPARTLDLVVLAVERGNGRRKGWLSNLHLGARDTERGGFVMLGKTFKGLTDEMLAWQTEKLRQLEMGRDDYTVYVRPELVVEIAFNDLQVSPQYPGGLALRFARVKRYRPEKPASESDTFGTVQTIYREMTGLEPPAR
ncbi:MAG: ATP-dependent DNA ligase [Bacteroidales bacterium]